MDMESLMAQAGEKLGGMHVKGLAAGGACIVDMSGKYDINSVTINPALLAQGAPAVENAVLSAMRDAKAKADTLIDDVMSDATAGMPIPQ